MTSQATLLHNKSSGRRSVCNDNTLPVRLIWIWLSNAKWAMPGMLQAPRSLISFKQINKNDNLQDSHSTRAARENIWLWSGQWWLVSSVRCGEELTLCRLHQECEEGRREEREMIRFTWTWNNVTESSSISTLTPTSFPTFFGVPGGVLLLAPSAELPLRLRVSIWELLVSEPSLLIVPSAIPSWQSWRAIWVLSHWSQALTNHLGVREKVLS